MSDLYYFIMDIATNQLPQILVMVLFIVSIYGLFIRFMRKID